MIIPTSNSPVILGRRLRYLRKIVRLTIIEFAGLADISSPSISYWENGQIDHPIKPKSMRKVIEGFKKVGIEVSERWLRTGEGDLPLHRGALIRLEERDIEPLAVKVRNDQENSFDVKMQLTKLFSEEVRLFTAIDLAVVTKVDHMHLMPFIKEGDFVGGVWQQACFLTEPTICIFKLNNQLKVAGIKPSQDKERFDIFYCQTQAQQESTLTPVSFYKVAPIFRIWRSTT